MDRQRHAPVEQTRPDMWSIPVPMPDNPLRYVLVYLLEVPGGVVLVGAGWNTEEAWTALVAGLAAAGYEPTDVQGVLVTHIHPDPSPLADFMDSLTKVAALDVNEVLPAHEYRFKGLTRRVDDLLLHHESRLAEVVAAVRASPGVTAWQIAKALTWARPWYTIPAFLRRGAAGETLAHLTVGHARRLVRTENEPPSTQHWFPC